MFRKFNTKTLLVIFALLLGFLLVSKFFEDKQGERTFKSELINIDSTTAQDIGSILLYPQSENHVEIKFTNTGVGKWQVQRGGINVQADSNSVKGLLQGLLQLKAQQLASTERNSWKDFSVNDSLGTRVKILNKANETLADIVIGRFSYNQNTRNGSTYVRLYEENEVYTVEGFLSMSINQKFEQWRVKTIISGNSEKWKRITFQYPGDSSFVLSKQNKKWMMDTTACDSAKIVQYLSRLNNFSNSNFTDGFNPNGKPSSFNLKIEGDSLSPILVEAYEGDAANKYIIHSSLNPEAYFSGNGALESLFTSKNKLLPTVTLPDPKQAKKKK